IPGTGKEGRVTKNDILQFISNRSKAPKTAVESRQEPVKDTAQPAVKESAKTPVKPGVSVNGHVEVVEMDRMRKMIAERMVESRKTSAHVTSFVEADVTNVVYWRNRVKNEFMEKENAALTFTPIFIEAIVKA